MHRTMYYQNASVYRYWSDAQDAACNVAEWAGAFDVDAYPTRNYGADSSEFVIELRGHDGTHEGWAVVPGAETVAEFHRKLK